MTALCLAQDWPRGGGARLTRHPATAAPPQRRRFHRRLATQAKRSGHGCSARATWRSTRHTARSRRPPTRQSALTSRSRSPLIRWPSWPPRRVSWTCQSRSAALHGRCGPLRREATLVRLCVNYTLLFATLHTYSIKCSLPFCD